MRRELDTLVALLPKRLNRLHNCALASGRSSTEAICARRDVSFPFTLGAESKLTRQVIPKLELLWQLDLPIFQRHQPLHLRLPRDRCISYDPRRQLEVGNRTAQWSHSHWNCFKAGVGGGRAFGGEATVTGLETVAAREVGCEEQV